MTDTVLIVVILGLGVVALLAYESYVASQNSLGSQLGSALGSLAKGLL